MNNDFNDELDRTQSQKGRSRSRKAGQESTAREDVQADVSGRPQTGDGQRRPRPANAPEERRPQPARSQEPGSAQSGAAQMGAAQQRTAQPGATQPGRPQNRPQPVNSQSVNSHGSVPPVSASGSGRSGQENQLNRDMPVRKRTEKRTEEPVGRDFYLDDDAIVVGDSGREMRGSRTGASGTSRQQKTPGGGGGGTGASRSAQKNAKSKKIKRIIIMSIAEIITLAVIFACSYVTRLTNLIQVPVVDPNKVENKTLTTEQQKHMQGYWTIAVFGVDNRDGTVDRGNTDVIMICNINRDTGELTLASIYRDTYLNTNVEKNAYGKINSAYANGGAEQALAALNKNLDLNIKEYVTFNWGAVADSINLLGGVDIDITKPEFNYINSFITETVQKTGIGSNHLTKAGLNHLDGVQAVAYGRLRLMDTDFQRTERQRLIIEKAFEKAKQADLAKLNQIIQKVFPQIGTNLEINDFLNLAMGITKYRIGETTGFPTTHGEMVMGKKGDCVIPQSLESNVKELHMFLFDKEDYDPSDTVKKISAKIAADSGMYKNGGSKETAKAKETKKETRETEETDSTLQGGSSAYESETDESGNVIVKPGETKPGETKPGETKPGETKPGETKPGETKPGETKPGETKPGETKPGETKPVETEASTSAAVQPGPGEKPTTPAETTTGSQNPGPGGSGGPGATTAPSTAPASTDVPIVSAPPTA